MHQIVVEAIHRTDMDLRKALYGNIVLSGGSTLTKGFGNRLLHEVQRLAVKDMRIKILAPPERIYTTWTGGSILAGLSTFKKVSLVSWARYLMAALTPFARCGWKRTSGRRTQTSSIPSLPRRGLDSLCAILHTSHSRLHKSSSMVRDGCMALGAWR